MTETITPNAPTSAATEQNAVPSLDSIAQKMTAMRELTQRNQIRTTEQAEPGQDESAEASSPVAPNNGNIVPEVDDTEDSIDNATDDENAHENVSNSNSDSTSDELIDFIEFAETNPNAKFKFIACQVQVGKCNKSDIGL